MPFTPQNNPRPYSYTQSPNLPGADRLFLDRELRNIGIRVNELVEAVKEIQDYIIARNL